MDDAEDRAFVDSIREMFTSRGGPVCFVELEATQAERLRRNGTPLRMAEKWPQRNVEGSRAFLLHADETYQLNSGGAFPYPDCHLTIDCTRLEPDDVARRIAAHFSLATEPAANCEDSLHEP